MGDNNKNKVLSVRLSYKDYGKLLIECEECDGNFMDYVRIKLMRDNTEEEKIKKELEKEVSLLNDSLKEAKEIATNATKQVDTKTKELELLIKEKRGISQNLKSNQSLFSDIKKELDEIKENNKILEDRLSKANQYLKDKSRGFFGDELVQF